jgi:gamma-glutamyltranspeptidase/glutathione hydrolase
MAVGALLQAAGGALMLAFAGVGWTHAAAVIAPMLLVLVGHGILQPTSQMGAIGAFPRQAGAAAALFGFTLNLVAALVGGWLGSHFNGTAVPMAIGVFSAGVVGSLTCLGPIRRITRPLLRTTAGLGALSLALGLSVAAPDASAQGAGAALAPEVASGRVAKSVGFGPRDLVVAAHPLAVEAGVEMLAAGGSALDAAIAAQWMLGLVEPQSSGLGGGALMLHRDAAGRLEAWDGRETAPAAARADQMLDAQGKALPKPASIDNGLSVGVPGVVAMLEAAHRRHGRLPWARLIDPALRVAEEGFPISPRLHTQIRSAQARMRAQGEPIASYFLDAQGNPRPAGERLRNPEYAQTLRLLARDGARVFHEGEIAQAIVDKVRAHPVRPGVMTLEDLRAYRPRLREPVCGPYRGLRLCTAPPPSAGGIAILQILGMLEGTPSSELSMRTPEGLHRITEAQRLAWADRTRHVADDQFIAVPVAGLLAPEYLRERAGLIRPERSLGSVEAGKR